MSAAHLRATDSTICLRVCHCTGGFAEPQLIPRYPQQLAEIMADGCARRYGGTPADSLEDERVGSDRPGDRLGQPLNPGSLPCHQQKRRLTRTFGQYGAAFRALGHADG